MKNNGFKETKFQNTDPFESNFECISSCDIRDGSCMSRSVEILKEYEN